MVQADLQMDLPLEDSEDLTDEHVEQAVVTGSPGQVASEIKARLATDLQGYAVSEHALRRRAPHYYWLVRFQGPDEKVLVFQVDWMDQLGATNG